MKNKDQNGKCYTYRLKYINLEGYTKHSVISTPNKNESAVMSLFEKVLPGVKWVCFEEL